MLKETAVNGPTNLQYITAIVHNQIRHQQSKQMSKWNNTYLASILIQST